MVGAETLVLLETRLGTLGFVGDDDVLLGVLLPGRDHATPSTRPTGPAVDAARQMDEYLAGRRRHFDVPLATDGTPFQRAVWAAVETIPFGEVRSYGEVADLIDRPASARPVGQAVGRNPHPIIRPCHRVVASTGIGGYDGHDETKRALLDLEGSLEVACHPSSGARAHHLGGALA
jgi:methylated-DNA-[protein]-cysteine S-methyltransferase